MTIRVLGDEFSKAELLSTALTTSAKFDWITNVSEFVKDEKADAFIDLLFDEDPAHFDVLVKLDQPVIIGSLLYTLKDKPSHFIRINHWNTFLKRPLVEAACTDTTTRTKAGDIFKELGKNVSWVPDIPGFISARVVSMIINEAYFSLSEKVSSKEEIDIAMKLGTNYPYGPFEWSQKIGLKNIYNLLRILEKEESRYKAADLLRDEANT